MKIRQAVLAYVYTQIKIINEKETVNVSEGKGTWKIWKEEGGNGVIRISTIKKKTIFQFGIKIIQGGITTRKSAVGNTPIILHHGGRCHAVGRLPVLMRLFSN